MRLTPDDSGKAFRSKIATRTIGQLGMAAHATTACTLEVEETRGWHLIMPVTGQGALHCDGRDYALRTGADALLLPNMRRQTRRAASSAVSVGFDPQRLEATLTTMAGTPDRPANLQERPLPVDLLHHRDLFASFLQVCRLVDAAAAPLAQALAVDDLVYRWMATALGAADGPQRADRRMTARNSALDVVCDLVRATPERGLTLTEMEAASGLSARALQYAFQTRFGCTPMQWQRRERLLLAREQLLQHGPELTVTVLAHAMGFSSAAAFATVYKRQFGETPTQTREVAG